MQPSSSDRNTLSVNDTYPESSQSDDFAIIPTPSPQPPSPNNDIAQINESEETDDREFHYVSAQPHEPEHSGNRADRDIEDAESSELSEFHLVELAPNNGHDAVVTTQPSPLSSLSSLSSNNAQQPQQPPQPLADSTAMDPVKSESNAYLEQTLDSMQLSPCLSPRADSASPKATMDEIVGVSEPLRSSSDLNVNESCVEQVEHACITDHIDIIDDINEAEADAEHTPLVPVQNVIKRSLKKNTLRRREYERYVQEKSEDANSSKCSSYFCLKLQDPENTANRRKQMVDGLACFMSSFTRYMDSCFGADQFTDESLSSNAFYESKKQNL
mmetsp:Transcript_31657/g.50927  ORF Transcript_31657/g.50927 Transcript_31657/m.50927 type:complete len:329 (-) Transcript_31657:437-1423(-)